VTVRSLACVFLLLPAAAGALPAQEVADSSRLADIIVTSTAVPMSADAVAAAVTVLDGDELRSRGIRFVKDALGEVPGLFVVQPGSFGAVSSLFARGGESDYVKVLVDGVPANQPGGLFDWATLSTDNVERIEIVRGPASVVHGSDAVTGVVQVITRRGSGPVSASASAEAGTFGATTVQGSAAGGGQRAGWSLGGSRFGTSGTYPFNNDFAAQTLSARVAAGPDDRSDASVAARYGWNTYHFPTDGSGVPVDSNQFSSGRSLTAGAQAGRWLGSRVEARVALALSRSRYEFDDRSDHGGDTIGFGFASDRRVDAGRRSADARINIRALSAAVLTLGAQYELEHERQVGSITSNFGGGSSREDQPPFDRSRHNWAPYAQATVDLAGGFGANAGLRVDENEAFGTFVTYRAGAAWRLPSRTRLRASFGTAFKAPSFAENFAQSPFEVGNPALEPERTRSWEAGAEQELLDGRASVSAAYFDQRFRNLIQYVSAAPGDPTYQNLGAADARGIETGAVLRPAAGLAVSATYTWLRTRVTDAGASSSPAFAAGEWLLRRPSHSARLGASYRPGSRASLGASVLLTGNRDDTDFSSFPAVRATLPAYQIVDLSAEVRLLEPARHGLGVMLTARLENALDAEYHTIVGYPGQGRTIFAGGRIDR
jgi:vitamin B12 transporter